MKRHVSNFKLKPLKSWLFLVVVTIVFGHVTAQASYHEAPVLGERVSAGALPPVEERLPTNPMIVPVIERIGDYGGDWRTTLRGPGDGSWLKRTIGYEHLVRRNLAWTEIEPNIAEAFEINDEATEFTFYLREGMKWSDGHPFTADDIVFWYEDVLLNDEIMPAKPSWLFSGDELVVVDKVDDYTVKFMFSTPNGLFLERLASSDGDIVTRFPRHYLEQFHIKYNPEGIDALIREAGVADWVELFDVKGSSGSAPWQNTELPTLHGWMITAAYGAGPRVVAERNPYYFKVDPEGNQLPYLDRVIYDVIEDVEVMVLRGLSGEIDLQDRHIGTPDNKAVFTDNMERGDYRFFETKPSLMNTMVLTFNLAHKDPVKREIFQNKDFRIGLSHAIDRQEIIDLVLVGQGEPFQAAVRPESPLYHEQLAKQYTEYDLELANEHLDKAGYTERDAQGYRLGPDGQRISFAVEVITAKPAMIDMLELIQGYWQAVGIDMQVQTIERTLFGTRKAANEHDANVWDGDGGLDAILEPRFYFPYSHESNFGIPWAAWYNGVAGGEEPPAAPRRQMELYDELKATGDVERQIELMREILQIAADEFYAIGISLAPDGYGIVKNNFRNVPASMFNAGLPYPNPAPANPTQFFIERP